MYLLVAAERRSQRIRFEIQFSNNIFYFRFGHKSHFKGGGANVYSPATAFAFILTAILLSHVTWLDATESQRKCLSGLNCNLELSRHVNVDLLTLIVMQKQIHVKQ